MFFWIKYFFLIIFFPTSRKTLEFRLFVMLNRERVKRDLEPLFFQNDLRKVARKHSQDMAKHEYFDHNNLKNQTPKDRFVLTNISEVVAGENLAKVRGYVNPVKTAHIGLMNSPGHKENILRKEYNCVGVGLAKSKDRTFYFTQNFSYRLIILNSFRSIIRFTKVLKVKISILDYEIDNLLIKILDRYDSEIFERLYQIDRSGTVCFKYKFSKQGKYKVKIYAPSGTKYRLLNEFVIQKRFWLW